MPSDFDDRRADGYDDRPPRPKLPTAAGGAMVVAGLVSLLVAVGIFVLFVLMLDTVVEVMRQQEQQAVGQQKQQLQEQLKQIDENKGAVQGFYGAVGAAGVVTSLIIIVGGLSMMKGRRYPLAMIAAVVALIPVTNCCFLIATPVGLWALIALFNADVKAAFRAPPRRAADDY